MTDICIDVADLIREVDPDGTLDASALGAVLGQRLAPHFTNLYAADVQQFVVGFSTGDVTSVADLAAALVRHFRLDEDI